MRVLVRQGAGATASQDDGGVGVVAAGVYEVVAEADNDTGRDEPILSGEIPNHVIEVRLQVFPLHGREFAGEFHPGSSARLPPPRGSRRLQPEHATPGQR